MRVEGHYGYVPRVSRLQCLDASGSGRTARAACRSEIYSKYTLAVSLCITEEIRLGLDFYTVICIESASIIIFGSKFICTGSYRRKLVGSLGTFLFPIILPYEDKSLSSAHILFSEHHCESDLFIAVSQDLRLVGKYTEHALRHFLHRITRGSGIRIDCSRTCRHGKNGQGVCYSFKHISHSGYSRQTRLPLLPLYCPSSHHLRQEQAQMQPQKGPKACNCLQESEERKSSCRPSPPW